jgi:hypothetical protein
VGGVATGLEGTLGVSEMSRAVPDRGWALQRCWYALYGAEYLNDCAGCDVAEAPARPGGRALRGGVRGTP